jgi:hypothetical protein
LHYHEKIFIAVAFLIFFIAICAAAQNAPAKNQDKPVSTH